MFPKTSEATVPAGSKLKDMIKEMNIRQRMEGATGGTNVAMNPVINVHGVPAGSEAAIAPRCRKPSRTPGAVATGQEMAMDAFNKLLEQIKRARPKTTFSVIRYPLANCGERDFIGALR
jgi:hypothetical protein